MIELLLLVFSKIRTRKRKRFLSTFFSSFFRFVMYRTRKVKTIWIKNEKSYIFINFTTTFYITRRLENLSFHFVLKYSRKNSQTPHFCRSLLKRLASAKTKAVRFRVRSRTSPSFHDFFPASWDLVCMEPTSKIIDFWKTFCRAPSPCCARIFSNLVFRKTAIFANMIIFQ